MTPSLPERIAAVAWASANHADRATTVTVARSVVDTAPVGTYTSAGSDTPASPAGGATESA